MTPSTRAWLAGMCFALSLPFGSSAQLVRQNNTTLKLPATAPKGNVDYTTENALSLGPGGLSFSSPICTRAQPGVANRLFVVERGGTVQMVNLDTMTKSLFLDLAAYLKGQNTPLSVDGECGLLGLEFHPDFANNGYFYVYYSCTVGSSLYQRVARFTAAGSAPFTAAPAADPATHQSLISQLDPANNHNGGDLHFGPDGYLYISVGDGGAGNDYYNNARFINKDFFAAILRIDVDQRPGSLAPNAHPAVSPGTYRIPPDNPFVGATSYHGVAIDPNTVRTEIWASGLRNPFRFSFDKPTGRLFVGDVGQDAYEEVDILTGGADAGWSYFEGNHRANGVPPPAGQPFVFPIYEYYHGTSGDYGGYVITGGVVSHSSRLPELEGKYIFCDEGNGNVWSLQPSGSGWTPKLIAVQGYVASFGEDPRNGDVLLCSLGGQILRLVKPTHTTPPNVSVPATLSATGAFSNLATLTPNAGIVAYEPNVSFWSDNATKQRWFSIPGSGTMIAQSENWTFPTGQVWIKHFEIETTRGDPTTRRRLETRFLVKVDNDVYGLTYKWRADNSDADLVPAGGQDETLNITANGATAQQVWHYPARSECNACHTQRGNFALSFNAAQLNRNHVYGSQNLNQLSALTNAGYFSTGYAPSTTARPLVTAADTTKNLETRVRSYLAANCAMCHQPGGPGLGVWDGRFSTATSAAGLINGTLNDIGGDPANRVIVPGDLSHSMLLKRLKGDGVKRMPPVASNVLDQQAIQLVTDWIASDLPTRQTFAEWQMARFGSTAAPNALAGADPDGDGLTNQQEYLIGTDPNDRASSWAMSLASTADGASSLSFLQTPNRAFVVETSSDLKTWSAWAVLGNQPNFSVTSLMKTFVVPSNGGSNQFFRMRISQE